MTAVEWLFEKLKNVEYNPLQKNGYSIAEERLYNQAKEMEKQQIIMAFWNSKHSLCEEDTDLLYLAEQYYNAKFNG